MEKQFDEYLKEIDALAVKSGAAEPGQSYVGWTGEESWRDMYDAGMDAEDAWGEEEDAARSMMG
jgi:hypothetical protein